MTIPEQAEDSHDCLHCGRASPDGNFCCGGCRFIYQTIHGLGFSDFYRYRTPEEAARAVPPDSKPAAYESYDDIDFRTAHFQELASGELKGSLHLAGIHCAGCVWLIEKLPEILPGVRSSRLNFAEGNVELRFDPARVKLSEIASLLHSLGYPSCPLEESRMAEAEKNEERILLLRLGVAGFSAANTMLLAVSLFQGFFSGIEREYAELFRWTSLVLALPAVAFSAVPFYRAAFGAVLARRFHIDLPISIAIIAAFLLSAWNTVAGREYVYFDSAAALVFLLLCARFVQRRALQRARREARIGWSFVPSSARLIGGNARSTVSLRALKPGDLVEVLPGERFPSDGTVEKGDSSVDYSILTGESLPKRVSAGKSVDGGTLNITAPLEVRLSASFASSRLGRLLEEMARGERRPARFLRFTEKVSAVFVVIVFLLAALTLILRWHLGAIPAAEAALALLIVTCPCALALASPLMMALAVSRAARRGILIKHVDSLERLNHVTEIYFDKTGTLTTGRLSVQGTFPEQLDRSILSAAQNLAAVTPSHPVSAALASLEPETRQFTDSTLIAGRGVSARDGASLWRLGSFRWMSELGVAFGADELEFIRRAESAGSSTAVLARDDKPAALFRLEDRAKPGAGECLSALERSGRRVHLLSGDRTAVVSELGAKLGIAPERCMAEKYPEEKREILRRDPAVTAMVGDGLNDGGALQASDIAIAVAGGIQSNLEVADIIIPDGDLSSVLGVFLGAKKVFRTLRLILFISAVYNIAGAALAISGWMNPLIAALLMPLSSATVIAVALCSNPFPPLARGSR